MTELSLREALEKAIPHGGPVGPAVPPPKLPEIGAEVLRDLLVDGERWDAAPSPRLFLRHVRVVGDLDLDACRLRARLRFEGCELEGTVYLEQARAPDIRFLGCELKGRVEASQISVDWNLWLDGSTVAGPVRVTNARIGGQLAMVGTKLNHTGPPGLPAFHGDGIEVGVAMYCRDGFTSLGQIRLIGARIGGQLDLSRASLSIDREPSLLAHEISVEGSLLAEDLRAGKMRLTGASVAGDVLLDGATIGSGEGEALNCSTVEVGEHFSCRAGFHAAGDVDLSSAKIAGHVAFDHSRIEGRLGFYGVSVGSQLGLEELELDAPEGPLPQTALYGDFLEVGGGMHCTGLKATGRIRIGQAKIEGHLNLADAVLDAGESGDEDLESFSAPGLRVRDSLSFAGANARGSLNLHGIRCEAGVSFRDARVEEGGVVLRGGVISYQLLFVSSEIEAPDTDAFAVDGAGVVVGDGLWCDGMRARGAVSFIEAKVGAGLSLHSLQLEGPLVLNGASVAGTINLLQATLDGDGGPALIARRLAVGGDVHCQDGVGASGGFGIFRAVGEMHLPASSIQGRLLISGAALEGSKSLESEEAKVALMLVGSRVDELVLCPYSVEGLVDLRDLTVRGFRDVEDGVFYGLRYEQLLLDGFAYGALSEPLDARQRLRWIERAQEETHNPRVFLQLADEFRRIGRPADVREVLIADQRRAYRELQRARRSAQGLMEKVGLGLRQAWHNLLYATVGYGYRNWLALGWLFGLLTIGTFLFWIWEESFRPARLRVPDFQPLLYAIDVTIPIVDLGQQGAWIAGSCTRWVMLGLAVGGYLLATALIAAATGLLARDQR